MSWNQRVLCSHALERVSYRLVGMWLSLVERCVRDAEVVGSNPAIPTICRLTGSRSLGRLPVLI